jgi:hypothetical protein
MERLVHRCLRGCLEFIQTVPRRTGSAGAGSANFCSGRCPSSATRCGARDGLDHTDPDLTRRLCSLDQSKVADRSVLRGGARARERTLGPPEQPRAEDGGLKREAMCRVQRVEPA